jgi:hypothetical protein
MDQTRERESVYSGKKAKIAAIESPAETPTPEETSATGATAPPAQQTPKTQMTAWLELAKSGGGASLADFVAFIKETRRVWLIAAGAIFGVMALVTLVSRMSEWARNARAKRNDEAVATVTPDRLIARCGAPAEDVTKDVFPVLMRTMSYQRRKNQKLVFAFSRTAEEQSDWVFLSMRDDSGARSYDTPEAKIAAMPCLDSKK